jgi:hypothetical protein
MTKTRKIGGQGESIEMTERKPPYEIKYYAEDYNKQARGDTKNIKSETWYNKDGKVHRDGDMAAVINYHNDPGNEAKEEIWYKNGKKHREIGPAESHYSRSGALKEEIWYKNGREMRTEGKYKKGGKTRRKRRRRKGTRKRRKKRSSKRH